jgi:hypothetical protein
MRRARSRHLGELTHSQELELWLGASHHGSAFDSDEQRRTAWFRHLDQLMQWLAKDGRRPQAWWTYECPEGLRYPGYDRERSTLYQSGVLGEEEAENCENGGARSLTAHGTRIFSFAPGLERFSPVPLPAISTMLGWTFHPSCIRNGRLGSVARSSQRPVPAAKRQCAVRASHPCTESPGRSAQ